MYVCFIQKIRAEHLAKITTGAGEKKYWLFIEYILK